MMDEASTGFNKISPTTIDGPSEQEEKQEGEISLWTAAIIVYKQTERRLNQL